MSAIREIGAFFKIDFDASGAKKGSKILEELKGLLGELAPEIALASIYHFVTGLTEEADALQKQADAMGISLKEMQEWNYAASMQGINAEALYGTLAKLGSGKFDKGLASLGITTKNTDGTMKSSTETLADIADKLHEIKDPAERNRKATEVLGKQYAKLMPLLADGREGIEALRKEYEEMGGGFTEEFAKDADEMGDNIDRVKTIWKNLAITTVSLILPTLVRFSKWVVSVIKPLVVMVRHSKMLETALAGAAIKGIMLLSGKIGPLGKALKALSGHFFKVILPLLILEDFLVFLAGGDSLFGHFLEEAFGKGTSDKVRDWISGVKKDFLQFVKEFMETPQKLVDDWDLLWRTLKADIADVFGPYIGGWINMVISIWGGFLDILTGGWDNASKKMTAIWNIFKAVIAQSWTDINYPFNLMIAGMINSWAGMFNFVLGNMQKVIGLASKVAGVIPGGDALKKGLEDIQVTLKGAEVADKVKQVQTAYAAETAANKAEVSAAKGVLNSGMVAPQLTSSVTVQVAPGTPAEQARAVGEAAKNGSQQANQANLRAAQIALKPGGA